MHSPETDREKKLPKIHSYLPVMRGNLRISNITFINVLLYGRAAEIVFARSEFTGRRGRRCMHVKACRP